ncbi:hypothetical protein RRG08_027491 [Elysia crispata]|uniref:Uncharacterized protein n=1 Tax=Elysia crispata TaxID=231223 RepID=A0AAE0YRH6_9GAST|nr:hypothetical protein RRG08_027491 [Elysia crispata]
MDPGSSAFQRVLIGHPNAFKQPAQAEVKGVASKKGKSESKRKLPAVTTNKMAGNRHNGDKLNCTCGRGRLDIMKVSLEPSSPPPAVVAGELGSTVSSLTGGPEQGAGPARGEARSGPNWCGFEPGDPCHRPRRKTLRCACSCPRCLSPHPLLPLHIGVPLSPSDDVKGCRYIHIPFPLVCIMSVCV